MSIHPLLSKAYSHFRKSTNSSSNSMILSCCPAIFVYKLNTFEIEKVGQYVDTFFKLNSSKAQAFSFSLTKPCFKSLRDFLD